MNIESLPQLPGYNYNEYALVLSPHEELQNKIQYIKKAFAEKYKSDNAKFSQPGITLLHFVLLDINEERLINKLRNIATGYHPFKIELKDFGSLPTHSIFINVNSQLQIKNLVKQLKEAQALMTVNKQNKPHFIDDPNLTIARKLLPWQYEKAWLEYSNLQFTGRFIAESMMLSKRKVGEKKYHPVQRFEFMNLPVTTKQGNLFV